MGKQGIKSHFSRDARDKRVTRRVESTCLRFGADKARNAEGRCKWAPVAYHSSLFFSRIFNLRLPVVLPPLPRPRPRRAFCLFISASQQHRDAQTRDSPATHRKRHKILAAHRSQPKPECKYGTLCDLSGEIFQCGFEWHALVCPLVAHFASKVLYHPLFVFVIRIILRAIYKHFSELHAVPPLR